MWALLSQWMSGLVAMTPFGCTTLLVLLKPSQQGLRPGAARVPTMQIPATELLTSL